MTSRAVIAPHVRRHAVSDVLDPLLEIDLGLLHSPLHPWDRVTKRQRDEFLLRMDTRGQTAQNRFKTVSGAQGKVLGARSGLACQLADCILPDSAALI